MSRIYRVVTSPMDDLPTITEEDLVLPSDFPVGGITSLQMEKALLDNQEGLYKHNYTYLCLTNGTYQKDHFYRFNISGDQFSWVDIGQLGGIADVSFEQATFSLRALTPSIQGNTLTIYTSPGADKYRLTALNISTGDLYVLGELSVYNMSSTTIDITTAPGYSIMPAGEYSIFIQATKTGYNYGTRSIPAQYVKQGGD